MNCRRDIVFSDTASTTLFECLIISGTPAMGLLHSASFKDVKSLQMSLGLLRKMWTNADELYIPKTDLESLHSMECKSAGSHTTDIPQSIAVDIRKLSRYYIYLLFRYCISAVEQGFTNRPVKTCKLLLTDIPTGWLQIGASTNYPSAPPMITHNGSSVYQQQQQQQLQPNGQTQMNFQQHDHQPNTLYTQSHEMQQQQQQPIVAHSHIRDILPQYIQQQACEKHNGKNNLPHHSVSRKATGVSDHSQQLNSERLYPDISQIRPHTSEVTRARRPFRGTYCSNAESDEDWIRK